MRNKAVQDFYSSLGVAKVNKKHLKDELLYKLYQKPKRDKHNDIPHHTNHTKNGVHEADLLFLPDDNGFKYALVVADVACNLTDAEPLQSKTNKEVLNAIQTIYKRKILSLPTQIITDSGSEFKGVFRDYFNKNGVIVKTADVGRHRQTAVVEAKNKIIGKAIHMRQTAQELETAEPSTEWTDFLPAIIKALNKKLGHKPEAIPHEIAPIIQHPIIDAGTQVRVALDLPKDVATNKRLHGGFRSSDIRWDTEIRTIISLLFYEGQPVLYKVSGKPHTGYTYNQLQIVSKTENRPPESTQKRFIVEALLGRKKIKNKIHFLVKWKNYPTSKNTWESREHLIKDVPKTIKIYESKNK